ncbi:MAG: hypothetical protein AB9866_15960 [Syntrophobacteraceae bacterium]
MHKINQEADQSEGVLRVSMDAKAAVKLGPFSRGGRSREKVEAVDHDFDSVGTVTPFSIFLPEYDELFISFVLRITSDYIWDRIEELWPELKAQYNPHTLLFNQDNGPENHSRRTQFMKRAVDFANEHKVKIELAYYPPYHSKYNPVERTHGVLEQYWNGKLLTDTETAADIAANMKWKGKHPFVMIVKEMYEKGVRLSKEAMAVYEGKIKRFAGLEKWFVKISPCPI